MFVGGLATSVFSFLLNLFLARRLTYSDYGTYVSLLSIFTVMTIPAASLTATIVRFAAGYFAKNEVDKASHLYKRMLFIWFVLGASLATLIYLINPLILNFLHINNPELLLIVAAAVGISYFGIVNTAYLQSMTKFLYLSFSLFTGSVFRILVGVALVSGGLGILGGVSAILATPIIVLIIGFIPLVFLLKKNQQKTRVDSREIILYSIPAVVGLLSLSMFITSDTLLVKHFFNPESAGLYGGLSVVGKVIFYFTAMIPSVMFPLVVRKHTNGEEYKSTFLLALLLVGFPSILVTAIYFLTPNLILRLFLGGGNYLEMSRFLGIYGIFMTIFSLLSLTVNFFLSIKKTAISYLVSLFAVFQIVLIYFLHGSFYQIIYSSIFSVSLLLAILLLYFYYIHRS